MSIPRQFTPEEEELCVQLYNQNASIIKISNYFACSPRTIKKILIAHGLNVSPHGRVSKSEMTYPHDENWNITFDPDKMV